MRGSRIVASLTLFYSFAAPRLTAQASGSVDPCTLLTAAEVSSVLGIVSLPGRPYLGSNVVCYYAADTGYVIGAPSVTVMVMTTGAFQNQKNMGGSLASQPVAGLGDEAYRVGSGGYVKLLVRKGSRAFSVTVMPGENSKATSAQVEQMEEGLARKAAARF